MYEAAQEQVSQLNGELNTPRSVSDTASESLIQNINRN